jgi:hypothetical protein
LLQELRAAIATKTQVAVLTHHATKRNDLKAALAACRIERQRLASEKCRAAVAGCDGGGRSGQEPAADTSCAEQDR